MSMCEVINHKGAVNVISYQLHVVIYKMYSKSLSVFKYYDY